MICGPAAILTSPAPGLARNSISFTACFASSNIATTHLSNARP